MAKGLVVHTASGTRSENYAGPLLGLVCAYVVCEVVFAKASQYAADGFRLVKEVSYTFHCGELKLTLDNGSCYTTQVFLDREVDVNAAVRNVLQQIPFPLVLQGPPVA